MQPKVTDNSQVKPISEQQQAEVVDATLRCIGTAGQLYRKDFASVPVIFDLRGKCAGMYQRHGNSRRIRFNPWLFAKYYQQSLDQTVPHEVAHYITDCLWGIKRVKPHGAEWKSVIKALGADARVTGDYDLAGIPVKQYQRFAYGCGCKVHQLTVIRHRKVLAGRADYSCRQCQGVLKVVSE